jgi:hypothetical protein
MKDDRLFLVHMLETSRRIEQKTTGLSRPQFDSNDDELIALLAPTVDPIIAEAKTAQGNKP